MADMLRLRKFLTEDVALPVWPAGIRLVPLAGSDPRALHAILAAAYTSGFGAIPSFEQWWPALTADNEFDPSLVFIAADGSDRPIGLAQCWTSGFVKDIAVVQPWRGHGIGEALLREAFHAFHRRGLAHVDLKVVAANTPALALYRRVGMVEAPL